MRIRCLALLVIVLTDGITRNGKGSFSLIIGIVCLPLSRLQRRIRAAESDAANRRKPSQGLAIKIFEPRFKPLFCEGLRELATICESMRDDIRWAIQDSERGLGALSNPHHRLHRFLLIHLRIHFRYRRRPMPQYYSRRLQPKLFAQIRRSVVAQLVRMPMLLRFPFRKLFV